MTSRIGLIFVLFFVLFLSPTVSLSADYAILVGVKTYGKLSGFNSLQFPENDVEELAKVLIANGYDKRRVTVLTQSRGQNEPALLPTKDNITRELELILKSLDPSDSVLLAFAGHGTKFRDGPENYFCPLDVQLTDRKNLISFQDIYKKLRICPAGRKLILSDACRNDPLTAASRSSNSVTRPTTDVPTGNTIVLYACSETQEAKEDSDLKHGVFFHYVIQGLKGEADRRGDDSTGNGNNTVELMELVGYTQQQVRDHVRDKYRVLQVPDLQVSAGNVQQLIRYPLLTVSASSGPPQLLAAPFSANQAAAAQSAWAKHIGHPVDLTNSIGMKLKLIPPGEFQMGSPEDEKDRGNDETPHLVRITKPYYVGVHEVTKGQFAKFIVATGYRTELEKLDKKGVGWNESEGTFEIGKSGYSWNLTGFLYEDNHPVVNVSWNDAMAFCAWLSKEEGKTYRLLTEAEWEYSCRAGTTLAYQTGNDPDDLNRIGNIADLAAKVKWGNAKLRIGTPSFTSDLDSYPFTAPVGRFQANQFGIFDMHGNACEWCSDVYDREYYGKSPTSDPRGPDFGTAHVVRGGSWYLNSRSARAAERYATFLVCFYDVGFRVVAQ